MNRMKRLPRALTPHLVLAALVAACAAPETLLQSTDTAAIATASTYAIEAAPPVDPNASSSEAKQIRSALESEIAKTLEAKGYRAASTGADLKVSVRVAPTGRMAREESVDPNVHVPTAVGPGDPYGGYRPFTGAEGGERLGMLLLTITDTRSSAIVWQATSEGSATGTASAISAVKRAAHAALEKIPKAHGSGP
jgi:Domain of unknown function (DUF4136)